MWIDSLPAKSPQGDFSDFSSIILLICFAMFNSDVVPLGPRIPWPIRFYGFATKAVFKHECCESVRVCCESVRVCCQSVTVCCQSVTACSELERGTSWNREQHQQRFSVEKKAQGVFLTGNVDSLKYPLRSSCVSVTFRHATFNAFYLSPSLRLSFNSNLNCAPPS